MTTQQTTQSRGEMLKHLREQHAELSKTHAGAAERTEAYPKGDLSGHARYTKDCA